MLRKARKNYSPKEKVAVLRKHQLDHVAVSELCDQYQLQPTVFYQWQRLFFEHGAAAVRDQSRLAGAIDQSLSQEDRCA